MTDVRWEVFDVLRKAQGLTEEDARIVAEAVRGGADRSDKIEDLLVQVVARLDKMDGHFDKSEERVRKIENEQVVIRTFLAVLLVLVILILLKAFL